MDAGTGFWAIGGPKKRVAELTLSRRLRGGRGGRGGSGRLGGGDMWVATALILRRSTGELGSEAEEFEDERL